MYEIGPVFINYNQIIINVLQFNRDCTPYAASKLFSITRHQADKRSRRGMYETLG